MPSPMIGRHIVTDPRVCHGQPTFRGTRILVSIVLEQVARGMSLETIIDEWRGSISRDAIVEALHLASRAFLDHIEEYVPASTSA